MSYAFFPGCSMEGTAHDYQKSTVAVSKALGLELPEIPGWTCCGSTSAHQTDHLLSLALPAKNLVAAEGKTVAVGCASCYSRLKTANYEIANDAQTRKAVATVVGKDYDGQTKILHMLEILAHDIGMKKIAETGVSAAEAADKLETVVSKKSGLLGVSELSNDMRDLREAINNGNAKAKLAVDKFTWTIAKWIGSYVAELNGLDMLVFTGGIGENDIDARAEICAGLGSLGIVLDPKRNHVRGQAVISAENSPVTVRVIPPAEDLMIVNHVVRLLAE